MTAYTYNENSVNVPSSPTLFCWDGVNMHSTVWCYQACRTTHPGLDTGPEKKGTEKRESKQRYSQMLLFTVFAVIWWTHLLFTCHLLLFNKKFPMREKRERKRDNTVAICHLSSIPYRHTQIHPTLKTLLCCCSGFYLSFPYERRLLQPPGLASS